MQAVKKLHNQELRADPAWSTNSEKIKSRPNDFPGFKCLRAKASASGVKERYYNPQNLEPSLWRRPPC